MIHLHRLIRVLIAIALIWNTPPAEAAEAAARGPGAAHAAPALPG